MSVYVIAEAGVNHNGNIKIAKQLIEKAKTAGCDCIKFQTFQADKIVTKKAKKADYQIQNMQTNESQYEMLKKLELTYEEFEELKEYSLQKQIDFLSTPFDEEAVDLLEKVGVEQYKISSGEITNKPLVQYIADCGKRILLSTGMSTLEEVAECLEWIYEKQNKNVILFHCTSNYPTPYEDVNMDSMITLKNEFGLPIGYSDHTEGIEIALMAVAMGATMIEKHFTLDKTMEGPDHKASLEPDELRKMVEGIRNIEKAFGSAEKKPTDSECKTREVARKSLVFSKDMKKGDITQRGCIICKRPGTGVPPKYAEEFLGRRIKNDCKQDTLVEYADIGEENP
ncbi:MAG: N-acetylneuraminate synthase [Lachnospiraceae bacterium]